MEKVIKLTRPDRTTYGGFFYEADKRYTFEGHGQLCSSRYAHAYWTAELAVLYNPIHAAYDPFTLFEAIGCVELDDGTKLGLTSIVVPVSPLESVPVFTLEQRVAWGIANVWPVGGREWRTWAGGWLTGKDRSGTAARTAAQAAEGAAWTAEGAAAWTAARAAAQAAGGGGTVWAAEAARAAAWTAAWTAARGVAEKAALGKAIAFHQHALARWVVQQTTNRWEPGTWPTFP